jgi:hypothetical protein
MPTPEASTKGRQLDALFTIEAPDGNHILRAKSWEELSGWWIEIEKVSFASVWGCSFDRKAVALTRFSCPDG